MNCFCDVCVIAWRCGTPDGTPDVAPRHFDCFRKPCQRDREPPEIPARHSVWRTHRAEKHAFPLPRAASGAKTRRGARAAATPSLNECVHLPRARPLSAEDGRRGSHFGLSFSSIVPAYGHSASPLFKLRSAVLRAPRTRLEGGPGVGRRGRYETPPQTILHAGAKSLGPNRAAFQRRAAPGPPRLRPRVRPPSRQTRPQGNSAVLRAAAAPAAGRPPAARSRGPNR